MTSPTFDLDAYLRRIEYNGDVTPTRETLERIHRAHATHIPFENIDVLLGRPTPLDLDSLQAKLVRGRRGGYCFEQNSLLAAALDVVGFRVTLLAARVRFGTTHVRPRSHMLLAVEVDGSPWLADVGFGGWGLLSPIPLIAGPPVRQFAWDYRLIFEGGVWVIDALRHDGWMSLYAFTTEPQYPVDFDMPNYYLSTHPESPFVRHLVLQRPGPEVRHTLFDHELTTARPEGATTRSISGDDALLDVLADTLGLELPRETRFRLPEPGATGF